MHRTRRNSNDDSPFGPDDLNVTWVAVTDVQQESHTNLHKAARKLRRSGLECSEEIVEAAWNGWMDHHIERKMDALNDEAPTVFRKDAVRQEAEWALDLEERITSREGYE